MSVFIFNQKQLPQLSLRVYHRYHVRPSFAMNVSNVHVIGDNEQVTSLYERRLLLHVLVG